MGRGSEVKGEEEMVGSHKEMPEEIGKGRGRSWPAVSSWFTKCGRARIKPRKFLLIVLRPTVVANASRKNKINTEKISK